jgi:hypothetical protein
MIYTHKHILYLHRIYIYIYIFLRMLCLEIGHNAVHEGVLAKKFSDVRALVFF